MPLCLGGYAFISGVLSVFDGDPTNILVDPRMIVEKLPPRLSGGMFMLDNKHMRIRFDDTARVVRYQVTEPDSSWEIMSLNYHPDFTSTIPLWGVTETGDVLQVCADDGKLFEVNFTSERFDHVAGITCPEISSYGEPGDEKWLWLASPVSSPDGGYTIYAKRTETQEDCPADYGKVAVYRFDNTTGEIAPLLCHDRERVSFITWANDSHLLVLYEDPYDAQAPVDNLFLVDVENISVVDLGLQIQEVSWRGLAGYPIRAFARLRVVDENYQGVPSQCVVNVLGFSTLEARDFGPLTACSQPADINISEAGNLLTYLVSTSDTQGADNKTTLMQADIDSGTVTETGLNAPDLLIDPATRTNGYYSVLVTDSHPESAPRLRFQGGWSPEQWKAPRLIIYDLQQDAIAYQSNLTALTSYGERIYVVELTSTGWYVLESDGTLTVAREAQITNYETDYSLPTDTSCDAKSSPDEEYALISCMDNSAVVITLRTGEVSPIVRKLNIMRGFVQVAWQENRIVVDAYEHSKLTALRWLIDPFRN